MVIKALNTTKNNVTQKKQKEKTDRPEMVGNDGVGFVLRKATSCFFSFFFFFFLSHAFIVFRYKKPHAALAMEKTKPINQTTLTKKTTLLSSWYWKFSASQSLNCLAKQNITWIISKSFKTKQLAK